MLDKLKRPYGIKKKQKIVGRGKGSGHGKNSGRGNKGANSRASGGTRPGFEGGQMPLIRRVPKRGMTFTPKEKFQIVSLERLNKFAQGAEVTVAKLVEARMIKQKDLPVKVLGDGQLKHALKVHAHAFSKSALEKIKSAGGTAEAIKR